MNIRISFKKMNTATITSFQIKGYDIIINNKHKKTMEVPVYRTYEFLKTSSDFEKRFLKFLNAVYDINFVFYFHKLNYFQICNKDIKLFIHGAVSPYIYTAKRCNIIHVYKQYNKLAFILNTNEHVISTDENSHSVKNIMDAINYMLVNNVVYEIIMTFIDFSLSFYYKTTFVNNSTMPLSVDIQNRDFNKIIKNMAI